MIEILIGGNIMKRIIALILCFSVLFSVCSIPAFAENEVVQPSDSSDFFEQAKDFFGTPIALSSVKSIFRPIMNLFVWINLPFLYVSAVLMGAILPKDIAVSLFNTYFNAMSLIYDGRTIV